MSADVISVTCNVFLLPYYGFAGNQLELLD